LSSYASIRVRKFAGCLAIAVAATTAPCALGADAARGEKLYERCVVCHALKPSSEKLPGPTLAGMMGRAIGGVPGFDYSPAMEAAGRKGLKWDEARLLAYLADPQAVVPGSFMQRPPLANDAERADIVAYLAKVAR
jgi:cytochrome c